MATTSRLSKVTVNIMPASRALGVKPHRHRKQWQMPEVSFLKDVFSDPLMTEQKITERFIKAEFGPNRIDVRRAVPPIVVPKTFKHAWCDGNWGNRSTHGHPRISIRMKAGKVSQCKYCENKFVRDDFPAFFAKREQVAAEEKYHDED
uniref:NDUFS6 n=1 Tax=Euglena gracilis TaxID=3039 RepID=UPI002FE4FAD7